ALDGVAARLALPFAAREIGSQFLIAQPLESDLADNAADRQIAGWGQQGNTPINPMAPARQQPQTVARRPLILGFRKDAAAASDDPVCGENEGVGMPRLHRARLLLSEPYDVPGRQFAAARRLVDIGGLDLVGNDAELAQ